MFLEVIAAFFVAYTFGILFNIKGRYLTLAGIGGSIGWFIYKFSLFCGISESISLFMASIGFSIYCESAARIYRTPATLLSVCALIPLVPGYGVYNSMYEFLVGNNLDAIDYGVATLLNAGSLALGVILVSAIFRSFKKGAFLKKGL